MGPGSQISSHIYATMPLVIKAFELGFTLITSVQGVWKAGQEEHKDYWVEFVTGRAKALTLQLPSSSSTPCLFWRVSSPPQMTGQKLPVSCRTWWKAHSTLPLRSACCCNDTWQPSTESKQDMETGDSTPICWHMCQQLCCLTESLLSATYSPFSLTSHLI